MERKKKKTLEKNIESILQPFLTIIIFKNWFNTNYNSLWCINRFTINSNWSILIKQTCEQPNG